MQRLEHFTSFLVMDIVRQARSLPDAIHFEIGEPDVAPAPAVMQAIAAAALDNRVGYTESLGLRALREKIADFYKQRYRVIVDPEQIVLTPGTSGAFLVAYAILLNAGDKVLFSDPAYPCYKNFAYALDLEPVFVPVDASSHYQLTRAHLQTQQDVRAVQISSPANPIGNLYRPEVLKDLIACCAERNAWFVSDEIYHGLVYDAPEHTALEFSSQAIVINGFSKSFSLPGLRLGWLILPPELVRKAEMVMQNLFIAAPTLSQYGALAAFDETYLTQVRETYRERRDYLYQALGELFRIDAKPEGAFYIWADVSAYTDDSTAFAAQLLQECGVAVTPGVDFGRHQTKRYIRFAYTRELAHLQEGVERLRRFLK